jgi:hypothetical protein
MKKSENGYDDKSEIMEKFCAQLAEHFDSVQILASSVMPSGRTEFWEQGSGNIFTRRAMVDHYADCEAAETIAESTKKVFIPKHPKSDP